ncbi:hypothetical protein ACLKA6_003416 [Drosophila palustris]
MTICWSCHAHSCPVCTAFAASNATALSGNGTCPWSLYVRLLVSNPPDDLAPEHCDTVTVPDSPEVQPRRSPSTP